MLNAIKSFVQVFDNESAAYRFVSTKTDGTLTKRSAVNRQNTSTMEAGKRLSALCEGLTMMFLDLFRVCVVVMRQQYVIGGRGDSRLV